MCTDFLDLDLLMNFEFSCKLACCDENDSYHGLMLYFMQYSHEFGVSPTLLLMPSTKSDFVIECSHQTPTRRHQYKKQVNFNCVNLIARLNFDFCNH